MKTIKAIGLLVAIMLAVLALFGTANASQERSYIVEKGDCLWKIAKKELGNAYLYKKIAADNQLKNPDRIFPGQVLKLKNKNGENHAEDMITAKKEKSGLDPQSKIKASESESVIERKSAKATATDENPKSAEENLEKAEKIEVVLFNDSKEESENHSPRELTAGIGYWKSPRSHTEGTYVFVDHLEKPFASSDYGVGFFGLADWGHGRNDVSWWKAAPGIQGSVWKEIGEDASIQAKPRLLYAVRNVHYGGEDHKRYNLMPGVYAEFSKVLSPRDRGILALDAFYLPDDSYANLYVWWEHLLNGRDLKLKPGAGALFSESAGNAFGVGVAFQIEIKERWVIGFNSNFLRGGPFWGSLFYYKAQKDLEELYKKQQRKKIKIKKEEAQ